MAVTEPEPVSFELERFELVGGARLEVSGRWYGVRGRRFVRPSLTIGGEQARRSLALLDHKPWAAADGSPWIAAFPWERDADELAEAELAVAPDIAVVLPGPMSGREAPSRRSAAGARRLHKRLPKQDDVLGMERARSARDDARRARQDALVERDAALSQRDAARGRSDAAEAQRDTALQQRDTALQERDTAVEEQHRLGRELRAALAAHESLAAERDRLTNERNALTAERNALTAQRDALTAERAATLKAERNHSIPRPDPRPAASRPAAVTQPQPEPPQQPRLQPPTRLRPPQIALSPQQRNAGWAARALAILALVVFALMLVIVLH